LPRGPKLFLFFSIFLLASAALGAGLRVRVNSPRENSRAGSALERLREEFGLIALDKTDAHSSWVLESLLLLLREGIPPGLRPGEKSLRYVFAYAGHDDRYDKAAYHVEAKAISIGGLSTYPSASGANQPQILSTLAHELGHAFLFDRLAPAELRSLGESLGGWASAWRGKGAESLHGEAFFVAHPDPAGAGHSITSQLATKNVHEWFADAYAAAALLRLGEKGFLGENWRERLRVPPDRKGKNWVDYNRVQPGLLAWLEAKARPGLARLPSGRASYPGPRSR
jgi:hypothetical protein